MNIQRGTGIATAVLFAVLTACGHAPRAEGAGGAAGSAVNGTGETGGADESDDSIYSGGTAAAAPGATQAPYADTPTPLPFQRTAFDNVDVYKSDVAQHIVRNNGAHTFSGALSPMLPAIVVLRITVDQNGRMTDVIVQRSRDDTASEVALASMRRTAYLPMPYNLANGPGHSLTFMETFLFNRDYRFQLRTLAPVQ